MRRPLERPAPRRLHQREVAGMQRAHGRHQRDALVRAAELVRDGVDGYLIGQKFFDLFTYNGRAEAGNRHEGG